MLKDIINRRLVIVDPHSKVSDAAKLMAQEDVGSVLILENGKPRGLLTDRDIVVRCLGKNVDVDDCTVENIMTEAVEVVHETDGLFDCVEKMKGAGIRRIPVVDDRGMAVGIISFGDILAILSKEFYEICARTTRAGEEERRVA